MEIITCDPLIYTMDHPMANASNQTKTKRKNQIEHKGLNLIRTISSKRNFGINLLIRQPFGQCYFLRKKKQPLYLNLLVKPRIFSGFQNA